MTQRQGAQPLEVITEEQLERIRQYTRRPFGPEELYTFAVTLCDNEVDRDGERFSDEALEQLAVLVVGKTGIFDHDPKGENQTARLFDAQVVVEAGRMTTIGEPYKYLKAYAYMVRTNRTNDLILEIDGGIKKEVSISCKAERAACSVCGADVRQQACGHQKGTPYNGQPCHTVLGEITDAYEWSFVAVPAQPAAGVTKRLGERNEEILCKALATGEEILLKAGEAKALAGRLSRLEELARGGALYRETLQKQAAGLLCTAAPHLSVEAALRMTEPLTLEELSACTKALQATAPLARPQLAAPQTQPQEETNRAFRMKPIR